MVVKMKQKPNKQAIKRALEPTEDAEAEIKPKVSKEVLVIAQEVKIVQSLACNDVNKRNRQVRKLRKWLQLRGNSSFPFSTEDFQRIWKGLYYNMWMSDKPLVQEELAENLGQLLECFGDKVELSISFFSAFLRTMCQEWFGIDQWRMDKFMMLVRRMLRYMLRVLKHNGWNEQHIKQLGAELQQSILAENTRALGLTMHFLDIFCDELAKVADGDITAEQVFLFLRPFVLFFVTNSNPKLRIHCRSQIFYHLLYQSALGREYSEKYNAWKDMGFPTSSIKDLELVEDEDANENEQEDEDKSAGVNKKKHLDPRAGDVDVFVPELPLDAQPVIAELELQLRKHELNTKRRKIVRKLVETFKIYQRGEFPLGVKTVPHAEPESKTQAVQAKAKHLANLEQQVFGTGRRLKQLNKRQRQKLLKSLNFENADADSYDKIIAQALPKLQKQQRKQKLKKKLLSNEWLEEKIDETTDIPTKNKKIKKQKQAKSEAAPKKTKTENKPTTTNEVKSNAIKPNNKTSAAEKINGTPTLKKSEWSKPLQKGEIEYFVPSRKIQLQRANQQVELTPTKTTTVVAAAITTPLKKRIKLTAVAAATSSPHTPASSAKKRVKIMLKNNTAQKPSEYIKQILSSPDVPYDASRKPGKGLLKPNLMPSPINPFYKKKLGLRLKNDTL